MLSLHLILESPILAQSLFVLTHKTEIKRYRAKYRSTGRQDDRFLREPEVMSQLSQGRLEKSSCGVFIYIPRSLKLEAYASRDKYQKISRTTYTIKCSR